MTISLADRDTTGHRRCNSSVRLLRDSRRMQTITPDEARIRFGELLHVATRTYREFEDSDGGVWRPVYDGGELVGYRLYKLHRLTRKLPKWRPRSR